MDNEWAPLRRSWHVVAASAEVGPVPVQVWLLGEPWCLVRLDDEVVAFVDRCPHRLAPLSLGTVVPDADCGSTIQCAYHGWRFAADGRGVEIPALGPGAHLPPRARLEAPFGVTERYGLVWLAPDEPRCGIHDLDEWNDPSFDTATSTIVRTPVGAGQLVDNFLDAAHFPYVHAATFGVEESAEVTDRGVVRDQWMLETTFETWYRVTDDPLVAAGERDAVQPQVLLKRASASTTVLLRLQFPLSGSTIAILFCCTPERRGATRVYKLLARDDLAGDADRLARFVADEDQILLEDLAILERYTHQTLDLDVGAEIHTRADRLSLGWRRLLADLETADA